jgi:predicted Zn-dependent peptidase
MNLLRGWIIAFSLMLTTIPAGAVDSAHQLNIDVEAFRLDNGMLFLVVERPTVPQIACRLAIRAGSALEEVGKTGIAHLLEHMMFKGTKNFGSLDPEKDRRLQEAIEAAYQEVLAEKRRREPDKEKIRKKLAEMADLRKQVQKIYIPQVFSSQLGKNGAVGINAFTTKDQTQYTASVPADMLEQWFSIVSEQLFEPSWREFYVEKEVVQREWAFRYVNSPAGAAWVDLHAAAYAAHPYRNPTIGWKSDMKWYNTRDAVEFHRKYYNPTNAVCVLVGNITAAEARRLAEIYFSRYPAGKRSPDNLPAEPEQQGPRNNVRYLNGARTPLVRIAYHGARMGGDDFYALDALTMILSHGRSARMNQNIVNKGLATEAWAYNPDNRYAGMVVLGGSPNEPEFGKKGSNPTEAELRAAYLAACRSLEALLLRELENLQQHPVSVEELERIKKLNEREFLNRMRSNEDLASALATLEVQTGWRYLADYLDRIARVTPEDVQRVAKRYFREENRTSVFIIPGGQKRQPPPYVENRTVSGLSAARVPRPVSLENRSIYPTPRGWKHPLSFDREPSKIIYPPAEAAQIGATRVFYLPNPELPLIDVNILVKAGEVDVEPAKTGLASILSSALVEGGTENYSPRELAEALDTDAIHLSFSVGEEYSTIQLSVLRDDWLQGLSLLQEVLNRPAFDAAVVRVLKQQAVTELRRGGEDAQSVAMREAKIWHFAGHPYGRDPLLGLEAIPNITPADLHAFLRTHFVPGNMVVAISGDISREEALDGIGDLLQTLPDTPPPQRLLETPPQTRPVLALIHKPGQVQSQVIMAAPSVRRTHPDFWKIRLLMDLFGGSDSLMYTRLRDDLGLVYSAGFFQTYKWQAGLLLGYIGCKADSTPTAIAETAKIMQALQNDVPSFELERKRMEALNSFVFNVDNPFDLVTTYSQYYLRGEPLDTLEKIQDAYLDTTRAEALELARKHLVPSRLQIFVVADKNTPVLRTDAGVKTLGNDLQVLAKKLGLPFREIALR